MTRSSLSGLAAPDPTLEHEIQARLDEVEAALEKATRSDTDFVTEVASHLVLSGGKRFRPLMVLLSGCFGEDRADPRLIQGAVAIELTHVATLYHDDVIDEAERRHGVPSVNARWGNNVAILSGDFLFARASELASDLGAAEVRLLAQTIATLCDGVIREVQSWGRLDQTVEAYTEIIRRKTAMLISTSCRLGGLLSDADPDTVETLTDFGMALGLGFQLSDDLMDLTSSEVELHKQPGQDMHQGMYTLPVLYTLEDRSSARSSAPCSRTGRRRASGSTGPLELVATGPALSRVREAVMREVHRAKQRAFSLTPGPAQDALVNVADFWRPGAAPRREPADGG
jgi:heptaprenyl diphosphate synthase